MADELDSLLFVRRCISMALTYAGHRWYARFCPGLSPRITTDVLSTDPGKRVQQKRLRTRQWYAQPPLPPFPSMDSNPSQDFTLPPSPTSVPTILQFGANSPLEFARATSTMAPFVSGVDLNCGCPQSWACAECLGAALMNKRELVADIVKEAKATLKRDGYEGRRTVSVKIRIHKDLR
jgi:hypothetical protein